MKEFKLYNGEITIVFNEDVHAYWLVENGKKKRLCGATTYLKMIDKPALIPWAVRLTVDFIRKNLDLLQEDPATVLALAREESNKQRDIAKELGTQIHKIAEDISKGVTQLAMPEDDRVARGVLAFLNWKDEHQVKVLEAERVVYSKTHGFVGTADMILEVGGEKYLGDIKTGNGIYGEHLAQTMAYKFAYEEEMGIKLAGRYILRLSKESEQDYQARMAEKGLEPGQFKVFEPILIKDDELTEARDFKAFLAAKSLYAWDGEVRKALAALKGV